MFQNPSVRKRLEGGQLQFGLFMNTNSPVVTEIAAKAGFDILLFDHEHGPGTVQDAIAGMNAARGSNAECWVRVPGNDSVYPKYYLDAGADGIMCPMISTKEEAERFVSYCRYPPHGIRGLAPAATRHSAYGYQRDEYMSRVKDDLAILVQIETVAAVENVDAIAAVDGVNVLFLGPIDLSASLGHLGEFNHPVVVDAMRRVEGAAKKSKKLLATLFMPGMDLNNLVSRGYDLIIGGGDIGVIRSGMQAEMSRLKKAAAEVKRAA
jgi:4-hydroxy-2-oxoheptanedioate aldolase